MNNSSFAIKTSTSFELSTSPHHLSVYLGFTLPLSMWRGDARLYNFYDVEGVRLNRGEVIYETRHSIRLKNIIKEQHMIWQ